MNFLNGVKTYDLAFTGSIMGHGNHGACVCHVLRGGVDFREPSFVMLVGRIKTKLCVVAYSDKKDIGISFLLS